MPPTEEITDSTDWLPTPLSIFAPLDAALRCQVCKDFYNTPMITSCSHTFCSLCIRRCLSADGKCPTCRQADQPSKLRRNWTVQELADSFATARPVALALARKAGEDEEGEQKPRKRRRVGGVEADKVPGRETRQTRSSGRKVNGVVPSQEIMILDSDEDEIEEYIPEPEPEPEEPKDGLVACPMCRKRMKEELVFGHLDRCDADNDDGPVVSKSRQAKTPPLKPPSRAIDLTASPAKHLPHLNYNLLRDNALKKKLQELGIPAWGARQLLIRRHTQWVDIVNANSDSPRPRSNRELLKDLDTWERTQGGNAPGQGQTGPTGVMRKDFDGNEWTGRHKGQFNDLIASARAKVQLAKAKAAEHAAETTASDSNLSDTPSVVKPPPTLSTGLSDMAQLKAEQEAIAAQTKPITTSTPASSIIPISGAQAFLQHAAEDIPMRDPTPSPDFNPPPSSQNERHTAHEERRYSNSNSNPLPSSQHTPAGSPPGLRKEGSIGETLASPVGVRRVPMFQVPEDPVRDNEGFGAAAGGG